MNFHSFENDKDKTQKFKKSLRCFPNKEIENHLFYAVVYGLMHHKLQKNTLTSLELKFVEEVLGRDFFFKLKRIEPKTDLDYTGFGFFERCQLMNETLAEFGYFLRFYERRNKFRYQLRQKLQCKNEMKRELSACIIQKFNGYDLLRNKLQYFEKGDLVPIDIVYKPTLDIEKPILCFFAPEISLAYQTCYDRMESGQKKI